MFRPSSCLAPRSQSLANFYSHYAPEKVQFVQEIAATYAGREGKLQQSLHDEYGDDCGLLQQQKAPTSTPGGNGAGPVSAAGLLPALVGGGGRTGGWEFPETKFGGAYRMMGTPMTEKGRGNTAGIAKLKAAPEKYEAILFQNNVGDAVDYTLFLRGCGVSAKNASPGGVFTLVQSRYKAFGPATFTDHVSDKNEFVGYNGVRYDLKRVGRGEGVCDLPDLKLFGDVDPADLVQGGVGNCWLISAIAALAEFDSEIERLFAYSNLEEGKFTVRLFDLPSQRWKEVPRRTSALCISSASYRHA